MNITKQLVGVYVIPEYAGHQNVVRRVQWMLRFERDGFYSDAYVETFIPVENIANFVSADQIGNELVLQWAFDAQGGQEFVDGLAVYHGEQIDYQIACSGQQAYTDGFDIPTQAGAPHIPTTFR